MYFVNAPCGGGKTHAAIEFAIQQAKAGRKIMIVQPTIKCIEEWFPKAKEYFGDTFKFHSKNGDDVGLAIYLHLESQDLRFGEIVFITHPMLMRLPFFPKSENWEIIIDEAPAVGVYIQHDLTINADTLIDSIEYQSDGDQCYVTSTDDIEFREIQKHRHFDEICKARYKLADGLLCPHSIVYGLDEQGKDEYEGKFNFLTVRLPSYFDQFRSVTIMAANFEQTWPYLLWPHVNWVENTAITERLRFTEHKNGKLLTVEYMFDRISRNFLDKEDKDTGKTNHQLAYDYIIQNYSNFIFLDNKKLETDFENGEAIPAKSHGLNTYDQFSEVVVLASYLCDPYEGRLYKQVGLDADTTKMARHKDMVYQAILRSSLRDPDNITPVRVFVPDEDMALFLQDKFPGCKLVFVGQQDMSKKEKLKQEMKVLLEKTRISTPIPNKAIFKNELHFCVFSGSLFTSIYDKKPFPFVCGDIDEFIANLRDCAATKYKNKTDNVLISPACFKDDTNRKRENVLYSRHLWVDVDDGCMTDAEFAEAIKPIKCVTFNTASSTDRTRFRAFIPTTTEMTPELYHQLMLYIRKLVKDAGFQDHRDSERYHGIDKSKLHPENLMYLPCQSTKENGVSFFEVHNTEILDPASTIDELDIKVKSNVVPFRRPKGSIVDLTGSIREQVFAEYRSIPAGASQRHHGFFMACLKLHSLGYSLAEILVMMPELDYDGSRLKKSEYQGVLNSLLKYGRSSVA